MAIEGTKSKQNIDGAPFRSDDLWSAALRGCGAKKRERNKNRS
jgi:hypothetical protein